MTHAASAELARPPLTAAATEAAPVVQKPQRFFHLDALRAALMFWGILVHSSTLDSSNVVFRSFAKVSGLVRMEAFFAISGFLAYMLLKKYGAKVTVKKRLLAIGLPFVAALVLLNPITNHLIHTYHNGPVPFVDYLAGREVDGAKGPMNWHLHLWFLLALFLYSLLAPVIERIVDGALAASRFEIRSPEFAFLTMAAAMAAACLVSRIGFELIKPVLPGEMRYVVRSIGNFLPFYSLGMLLFASPRLRGIFSTAHWVQTVVACALLFGANNLGGANPSRLQEILILVAQTYLAMTLSSLLFWAAEMWLSGESETVRRLSDSAYSVYLFHFLVIYLFAHLLRGVMPGSTLLLTLVAAATFVSTLCLHRFVIRRFPVLELLFNGKPLRRPR